MTRTDDEWAEFAIFSFAFISGVVTGWLFFGW